MNTQSNVRSSNIAPNDSHTRRIWSRNAYNRCSSRRICSWALVRSVANTEPMRDVKPESYVLHSVAICLQSAIARSPDVLPRHLLKCVPHLEMIQLL